MLAQERSIKPPQTLALQRLHATLVHLSPIQPDSHVSTNIVDLAKYVYDKANKIASTEDALRKLVSQFMAFNFSALQAAPGIIEMIAKGGDFSKDMMVRMCGMIPPAQLSSSGKKYIENI